MAGQNESNGKKSKIETLREQQAKIQARIAEIERAETAKARKEDTRLKVVVGAACMADAAIHDDTRNTLRGIVERAVKAPRDREFLKSKGWLN
jgi:hypothetical protein